MAHFTISVNGKLLACKKEEVLLGGAGNNYKMHYYQEYECILVNQQL
jgi:hypothetical protein